MGTKTKIGIVCVGCHKDASELEEYGKDTPVTEDGTYENRKFVCTECYMELIRIGLDVGPPSVIQIRMIQLRKTK